ncbi:MAG: NAD(P)/FAD-dependent oxidoreductase [Prochlorothrix sp.]
MTKLAHDRSPRSALSVTLFDRQPPAQGATGAALGLCMGVISRKTKGRAWELRHQSLQRYPQLLAELAQLGHPVPHNAQGLLKLEFEEADRPRWQRLIELRQQQGYSLELWEPATVRQRYALQLPNLAFALASPQDRQIQPRPLTHALLQVAQQRGLSLQTPAPVQRIQPQPSGLLTVQTAIASTAFDRVILTAGLDSPTLLPPDLRNTAPTPLTLEPVLGQGAKLRLPHPLSPAALPVFTAQDLHLVPLGGRDYWLGATLEFQPDRGAADRPLDAPPSLTPAPVQPNPQAWADLWAKALEFWPELQGAEVLEMWAGERPRPVGRSAPVIEVWPGAGAIVVATGHYRNGVLLAPATAQRAIELLNLPPG